MLGLAPLSAAASVRTLDEAGMAEITGSTSAAAVFVAPRGCERAPGTCKPLFPWWDAVGAAFPGVAWRLSCEEQRELCAEKSRLAVPRGVEPLFVFWTGNRFDRYRGNPSPVDLLERVREVAYNSAVAVDAAGGQRPPAEPAPQALEAARAAADAYLERRATLRRAEAALPAREAVESLDAYLEKWPTHMNAILMRAHAAQQARDAGAALHWFGKAIDLEPQNARLLAMAAAVRLAIGEHEEGAALLERALAPAPDSHDAEDEAGRKKLAQVLTQVYMKYGRGPDDFETIPY